MPVPDVPLSTFDPLTLEELKGHIKTLKFTHHTTENSIPSFTLMNCFVHLAPVLLLLFNLSLSKGCFPSLFKSAITIPLHKSNSKFHPGNYRSISQLHTLSKLLEKIVKKRLLEFLESFDFILPSQYGFRNNSPLPLLCFTLFISFNRLLINPSFAQHCLLI